MILCLGSIKKSSEKNKAKSRARYQANPEKVSVRARQLQADPEKKGSVRDSYTTLILNLSNLLKGSDIKRTSRRTVQLKGSDIKRTSRRTVQLKGSDIKRTSRRTVLQKGRSTWTIQLAIKASERSRYRNDPDAVRLAKRMPYQTRPYLKRAAETTRYRS